MWYSLSTIATMRTLQGRQNGELTAICLMHDSTWMHGPNVHHVRTVRVT